MIYVILFLLISGICGIYFSFRDIINSTESRRWPSTEGTVNTCDIYDAGYGDGPANKQLNVLYEFEVNHRTYRGHDIWHGSDSSEMSKEYAESYAELYPAGTKVKVYYKPDNPQEAVLEPGGLRPIIFFYLAGSIVFVLLAIFIAYAEYRWG